MLIDKDWFNEKMKTVIDAKFHSPEDMKKDLKAAEVYIGEKMHFLICDEYNAENNPDVLKRLIDERKTLTQKYLNSYLKGKLSA